MPLSEPALRRTDTFASSSWGTEPEEGQLEYPCDRYLQGEPLYRGITIRASPEVVFRWLCQLQVANYSYDWIDNRGRRSPQKLTPGLGDLSVGQPFGVLGQLVEFEPGRQITTLMPPHTTVSRLLGRWACTYLIVPQDTDR